MAKVKAAVAVKPDEEWMVEEDLRTLIRAREIQSDQKRMAKVKALAQERLKQVASVMGETDEK